MICSCRRAKWFHVYLMVYRVVSHGNMNVGQFVSSHMVLIRCTNIKLPLRTSSSSSFFVHSRTPNNKYLDICRKSWKTTHARTHTQTHTICLSLRFVDRPSEFCTQKKENGSCVPMSTQIKSVRQTQRCQSNMCTQTHVTVRNVLRKGVIDTKQMALCVCVRRATHNTQITWSDEMCDSHRNAGS